MLTVVMSACVGSFFVMAHAADRVISWFTKRKFFNKIKEYRREFQ